MSGTAKQALSPRLAGGPRPNVMEGWVKINRKLLNWEWYGDSKMVHLLLHMILKANHEPGRWKGIEILPGQFVSGRLKLSKETGISQQSLRTCISRLKSTNELTIKSTNKYSIFTLKNWEKYQSEILPTSKSTNNQPAINQQLTTNKNEKNKKNNTGEVKKRPRDEVWDTLCLLFKMNPTASSEKSRMGKLSRDFKLKGAGRAEIEKLYSNYPSVFPGAVRTPEALFKHYDLLIEHQDVSDPFSNMKTL